MKPSEATTVWPTDPDQALELRAQVFARPHPASVTHSMEFVVVHVGAIEDPDRILYCDDPGDLQHDPDKGEFVLKGWLKWDGCMDAEHVSLVHYCGLRDAEIRTGAVIRAVYRVGQALIPAWDDEVADCPSDLPALTGSPWPRHNSA